MKEKTPAGREDTDEEKGTDVVSVHVIALTQKSYHLPAIARSWSISSRKSVRTTIPDTAITAVLSMHQHTEKNSGWLTYHPPQSATDRPSVENTTALCMITARRTGCEPSKLPATHGDLYHPLFLLHIFLWVHLRRLGDSLSRSLCGLGRPSGCIAGSSPPSPSPSPPLQVFLTCKICIRRVLQTKKSRAQRIAEVSSQSVASRVVQSTSCHQRYSSTVVEQRAKSAHDELKSINQSKSARTSIAAQKNRFEYCCTFNLAVVFFFIFASKQRRGIIVVRVGVSCLPGTG